MNRRWIVVALVVVGIAAALPVAHAADVDAGRKKAEVCAACHGPDGNGNIPGTPSVAAMPAWATHWQLIMYRDGRRKDPQMTPFAEKLSDGDMADLSAFYAAQAAKARSAPVDPQRAAVGRALAQNLNCVQCHGPGLMGQNLVPRVAGQDFAYLKKRLSGYKAKSTSDLDGMMTMVAQSLSDEDVENLVHFMSSVAPQ